MKLRFLRIAKHIVDNDKLNQGEKMLLAYISSLSEKSNDWVFARNKDYRDVFMVEGRTIQYWLEKLLGLGLLETKQLYARNRAFKPTTAYFKGIDTPIIIPSDVLNHNAINLVDKYAYGILFAKNFNNIRDWNYKTISDLAVVIKKSVSTVRRYLKRLKEIGTIVIKKIFGYRIETRDAHSVRNRNSVIKGIINHNKKTKHDKLTGATIEADEQTPEAEAALKKLYDSI